MNCNGIEGKVHNLARRACGKSTVDVWIQSLLDYWKAHEVPQYNGIFHPNHKTEEEKRIARNKKAKKRRAAKKAK